MRAYAGWTLKRGRVRADEDGKEREGLLIPVLDTKILSALIAAMASSGG